MLEDEPFATGDISAMFRGREWNRFNELVSTIPLQVSPYAQLTSVDLKRYYLADYLPVTGLSEEAQDQRRRLAEAARELVAPLVAAYQSRFKKHVRVGVSVLVSAGGAKAQRCHCDFNASDLEGLPPDEYPFSILLPVTAPVNFVVYARGKSAGKQVWSIPLGYCARFRGDLWHAGGTNPLDVPNFRIHIYFCTEKIEIPNNAVYV